MEVFFCVRGALLGLMLVVALLAGCVLARGGGGAVPLEAAFTWSDEQLHAFLDGARRAGAAEEEAARAAHLARQMASFASLQPILKGTYRLPAPWAGPGGREASAYAVAGYVAGRRVPHRRELVIVCAALGGEGERGAAAVLALADAYSRAARYHLVPARTMLFAVWTPSTAEEGGLHTFLRYPTWDREAIRAVYVLGGGDGVARRLEALAEAYAVPIHHVPAPHVPAPEGAQAPEARARASSAQASSAAHVRRLAEEARARIRPAVMAHPAAD